MFKRAKPWKRKKPTSNTFGPSGFERKRGRWVLKRQDRWIDDPEPRVGSDVIMVPPADPNIPQ